MLCGYDSNGRLDWFMTSATCGLTAYSTHSGQHWLNTHTEYGTTVTM